MHIDYRKAEVDDADVLELIDKKYFSYPHTKEQFLFEINDNCHILFVAVACGIIIGYIGLQYIIDEGYITNIVVDLPYRRNGVGDNLLKTVLDFGKDNELSFISLEVRSKNSSAIDMYLKNNFIVESQLKNYYSNPDDDALIMTNRCLT